MLAAVLIFHYFTHTWLYYSICVRNSIDTMLSPALNRDPNPTLQASLSPKTHTQTEGKLWMSRPSKIPPVCIPDHLLLWSSGRDVFVFPPTLQTQLVKPESIWTHIFGYIAVLKMGPTAFRRRSIPIKTRVNQHAIIKRRRDGWWHTNACSSSIERERCHCVQLADEGNKSDETALFTYKHADAWADFCWGQGSKISLRLRRSTQRH